MEEVGRYLLREKVKEEKARRMGKGTGNLLAGLAVWLKLYPF